MKHWGWALIGGAVGLLVGVGGTVGATGLVSAVVSAQTDTRLSSAYTSCEGTTTTGLSLEDKGQTLVFDLKGKDDRTGAAIADIACVFSRLSLPSRVTSHMDQTTSVDGRQTETWDGLSVSWSYHPDRGMDGVIQIDQD